MPLGSTGLSGFVVPNLFKSRPSPTIYLNESAGGQRQSLRVLIQTNLQYLPQVKELSPTLIEKEEITRRPLALFAIDEQAGLIIIAAINLLMGLFAKREKDVEEISVTEVGKG